MEVLAQSNVSTETIGALVAVLLSSGFAVWYGRYVTTVSIPKLVDQFTAEAKAARDAFQMEARMLREAFAKESDEARAEHRSELAAIRTAHADDIRNFWLEHKSENAARRQESEKMAGVIQSLADSLAGKSGIVKGRA
jgi:cytoskeletal protein RodZ